MEPIYVILGLVALILLFVWSLYNGLVRLKTQIQEAWAQIDVQLKRRTDLIPNLVETVKGYAKHEKGVFEDVTKARATLLGAQTPHDKSKADDMLSGALKSLFAVAEAYPQLKANENFVQLQRELSDTEDKVAYARQFYNSQVMEYNVKIKIFPNMLLAGPMGFSDQDFFKTEESEKQPAKVSFE